MRDTTAMNRKAIICEAEEGGYLAEVPALPGCVTQGETREELEANLREANLKVGLQRSLMWIIPVVEDENAREGRESPSTPNA